MNWDAVSAIGEIIGAIAVVASLVYLAIQVKQNTSVARSATRQAIAESAMEMAGDLVSDKELAEAFLADLKGSELDEADQLRLYARSYVGMRHWENIHYQFLSGMLEEDEWQGFRKNLSEIMKWKSLQTYWENEGQYYSRSFQTEVAKIRAEIGGAPDEHSHSYLTQPKEPS